MLSRFLILLALLSLSCSSGESEEQKGVCSGKGWLDTCHYLATCNTGRFELVCGYGDGGPDECACLRDKTYEKSVPKEAAFCNSPDAGKEKYDEGLAAMASACGWSIGPFN